MLKLAVFDWDGTLADSISKIIACKSFLAKKYNLPCPSEETIKNVLGKEFETALAECFPQASHDVLQQMGENYHELMQQEFYQADLFPGSIEVLNLLKNRGIKLAIASSKNKKELDGAIAHHNLVSTFDLICCGDDYQSKPDPFMLNYIMKQFNATTNDCVMIGDTTTDILFATNAKVKTVGVTFGAHSAEMLRSMSPFALADDWSQLIEVINKLCNLEHQVYCPFYLQE